MGGRAVLQLADRLKGHGGVALHNPGGDIPITLPGCVLNHYPTLFLGQPLDQADGVVIVQVRDRGVCPQSPDIGQPLWGAALGHPDHGPMAQLGGGPGHPSTVVPVGGGGKGELAQPIPDMGGGEQREGQILRRQPQLPSNIAPYGVAPAQHLKGVEREPPAFILHMDGRHSEMGGQTVQAG